MAKKIFKKLKTIAENVPKVYKAGLLQDVLHQEKTVTPSAEIQEVLPDDNYVLSKVTVEVPDKPFINTSKISDFQYFFYGGSRMEIIDQVHFHGEFFMYAFHGNKKISKLPQGILDLTSVNATGMCYGATALTEIKTEKWKSANINGVCKGCTSLIEVNLPNCKLQNATNAFENCTALETVITGGSETWFSEFTYAFKNCTNLKNLILKNIRKSLQIGSGETWGHLLTVDSLINTVKELINTGSARTLTMGSVNKAKIADIWCVVTDDTTAKMAIEIVEAGTEGAMTLEDFAGLKGWSIT